MEQLLAIVVIASLIALGFGLGMKFQSNRLAKLLREPTDEPVKNGLTPTEARIMYDTQLIYDCPLFVECGAVSGELCNSRSVWIHQERFERAEEGEDALYDVELSHDEHPNEPGEWREVELSDCRYGCKVYENQRTGRRALMHNSTYGCRL